MSRDKEQEISTDKALEILGKNIPDIVFTAMTPLLAAYPILAILFLTGKGIYGAWGDFGQARLNEFVSGLEKKQDSFDPKILETDKFKSVFLSILEKHMKESSEERRGLLRNYLISMAQGKNPSFDYHTKLLNVLDQITGDELRLFVLLPNIIKDSNDEFLAFATEETRRSFDPSKREVNMNTVQVRMRLKGWKIRTRDLSSLMRFLTNYGIISSYDVSTTMIGGGGSNDLIFAGLTDAGSVFYNFIDDPRFEKEIVNYLEYRDNPSLSRQLQDD